MENVCYGFYCSKEIVLSSIIRSRKVNSRFFYSLSHDLIKKSLKKFSFPITEIEFSEQFLKHFSLLLENKQYLNLAKKKIVDQECSLDKSDSIKLCKVCYKIFSLAYSIEHNRLE
jgi:hypothetical protein